jgi:hypothetical protein
MKLEFFRKFFFSKNIQISTFMKIRPAGAEMFHGERRMDGRDEANSRFSQFCESAPPPKSESTGVSNAPPPQKKALLFGRFPGFGRLSFW